MAVRNGVAFPTGNSGFPKSLDVSKALDKAAGVQGGKGRVVGKSGSERNSMAGDFAGGEYHEYLPATDAARQWQGWGTALKPAHEPICVARKPLVGTVAANVLAHGTGALNIAACRVATPGADVGRWPANLAHDGSDEVLAGFPETKSGGYPPEGGQRSQVSTYGKPTARGEQKFTSSEGSAARFFYCAKASKRDRDEGNTHPTVKPTELMRYLCRLVTPTGGVVLDPFMGSGSTGKAAALEGFRFIGIEREAEYLEIARARIQALGGHPNRIVRGMD